MAIFHGTRGDRFSLLDPLPLHKNIIGVKLGELKIIGIRRKEIINKVLMSKGKCKEYPLPHSQRGCLANELLKIYQNETMTKSICQEKDLKLENVCLIPQIYGIFEQIEAWNPESMIQCTNEDEYSCMHIILDDLISKRISNSCPKACTTYSKELVARGIKHDLSSTAILSISFSNNQIHIKEECYLFGFSDILVAFGGSLGLFLGFSCFQCGTTIIEGFSKLYRKIMSKT